ncbi:MAG TPA: family 10 glycosylhydrolase, partial [Chitinophagaceae bacterium]|nr:family 10 glycosylhydrolase [Chitinophagaceae bacterium]
MKKNVLFFFLSSFLCIYGMAQKSPKRELRGAWISTHFNLDWPTASQTPAQQRTALISILEQHKATGMNVIYFQVRNQCDALYPSPIEPWSSTLTGVQGKDPGWDPLQFAIDECHKRGLELHAWLNPYRAVATASQASSFVPGHVAKQHPEWLLNNGSTITLNPGIPAVRNYIMSVITDITQRYDVDGIHFDDYFYPPAPFNDDATYIADPRGFPATTTGRGDWRRDNINLFIQDLYSTLTSLKPWVKFGVSPSGIYRSSTNPAIGSNTSAGASQHYSAVYADTKKWLQSGWVDYIAPQVYWYIGQTGSDYKILIPWWNNQAINGRHIYIGQAIYKVNDAAQGAPWLERSQIPNQMRMNRDAAYQNVYGEIAFRTAFLRSNPLNVRDSIRLNIYKRPALLPAMAWKDNTSPPAPFELLAVKQPNNAYILNWTKPAATSNEMDKVRQFVIYRSESPAIDISDTANLLFITPTDVTSYTDNTTLASKTYYYTVTAVDRLYNESIPSNVTDYLPPTITCPLSQYLTLNTTCSTTLPDYRTMTVVSDDVTTTENIVITQSPAVGTIINGAGNNVITLTATDASGKASSCTFSVIAEDKTPPVITAINNTVTNGSTTKIA